MSARTSDGSLAPDLDLVDRYAPGFRRTDGAEWSRAGVTAEMVRSHKEALLAARDPSPWQAVAAAYRAIIERLADLGDPVLTHEMQARGFGHTDIATNLDAIELVHTAVHEPAADTRRRRWHHEATPVRSWQCVEVTP